jgi:hypothetical protein
MTRVLRALLAALAVSLPVAAARAQTEPVPMLSTALKPDVQVVIAPGNPGRWQVSAVFMQQLPRPQLKARAEAILAQLPGKSGALVLEDRTLGGPLPGADRALSSISLVTATPLVDVAAGTLALTPFVRALQDLDRVNVTYLLPDTFVYRGVRRVETAQLGLDAALVQGVYAFSVNIKDHTTVSLEVPTRDSVRAATAVRAPKPQGSGLIATLLILCLAAAGAAVTFGIVRRRLDRA